MDITTNKAVQENDSLNDSHPFTYETEEEDDFEDNFFDDEKSRKPKGKKIRKMRSNFDR